MDFETDTSWVRGILHPDETLIWTGKPSRVSIFRKEDLVMLPVGAFMLFIWFYFTRGMLSNLKDNPGNKYGFVFMCVFLLVVLYTLVGRPLLNYRIRKKARYALTSRRIIADNGKERKSFELTNLLKMTVTRNGDGTGNIAIGERSVAYRRKGHSYNYVEPELLLENLADVDRVEYRIRSAVDQAQSMAALYHD